MLLGWHYGQAHRNAAPPPDPQPQSSARLIGFCPPHCHRQDETYKSVLDKAMSFCVLLYLLESFVRIQLARSWENFVNNEAASHDPHSAPETLMRVWQEPEVAFANYAGLWCSCISVVGCILYQVPISPTLLRP